MKIIEYETDGETVTSTVLEKNNTCDGSPIIKDEHVEYVSHERQLTRQSARRDKRPDTCSPAQARASRPRSRSFWGIILDTATKQIP